MEEPGPARKKRRGGIQQRVGNADTEAEATSALETLVLDGLAAGTLSAAFAHSILTAAVADFAKVRTGCVFPALEKLAKVKHSKNFEGALFGRLKRESQLPAPTEVNIPLQGVPDDKVSSRVMLPHEILHALYQISASLTEDM